MIVLIDNYDSFSYNLYQLAGSFGEDVRMVRNDKITVEKLEAMEPRAIILSPGPGRPKQAGICLETVSRLGGRFPILGVCLGHQAICMAYGAAITYAGQLMHGKTSIINVDNTSVLFREMNPQIQVGRYHSLAADPKTIPDCLRVIARTEDGEVMAVEHRQFPVFGVQFHPESILTPDGREIVKHFLTR